MTDEHRYKDALLKIANMNFNTGRADLLGLRIKEVVREAICPDKPCPQCNGVGEVPQIRTPDHGDCRNWESRGPYNGWCKLHKDYRDEMAKDLCHKFDHRLPMQTCPSCDGKKFTKMALEKIDDRFDILDL